ncbi:YitT family protein [Thermodesulfobacteriota bacterium]
MTIKTATIHLKFDLKTANQVLWNLGLITIGSVLCAVAVNGILVPRGFVTGGLTGIAIGIHYLMPSLNVGWLYFLLNIPLYIVGFIYIGRRFFLYSIAGLFIFSGAITWINVAITVQDNILAAMMAGIISGTGSGIILRSLGSAGGMDILSIILLKRFSVRLGSTTLAVNGSILLLAALLFSLESALYTLIFLYINSQIINLVVTGLSQRKAVFIISSRWDDISQKILKELNRGVTIIHGKGGYSGREEQIIYAVVTFRELPRLKELVRHLDPEAFVVVNETLEVMGRRIGNQPHW